MDERRFHTGLQCKGRAYERTGKDVFRRIPVYGYLYGVQAGQYHCVCIHCAGEDIGLDTAKTSLICQKGAFLCAQPTVEINTVLTKKFTAGFFGGEGFILQQIQGSGMAFLEVDGDVVERVLAPGEVIKVDTGNVFAFEPSISYEIETVKGVKNILVRRRRDCSSLN